MEYTGNLYVTDNNVRLGNEKVTKHWVVQYIPDHQPDWDISTTAPYTLVDNIIKDVTPNNFTTGFERLLKEYGGAIIIISRKNDSKNINDALRTYEAWSTATLEGNFQNDKIELEWIYHSRTDTTFSEKYKFKIIIKGQLLVISVFKDNLITTGKQYPLIMIQIINILLHYTLLGVDTIKNELVETLKKTRNLVLIKSSQFNLYFDSRKTLIEDQKNILSSILRVLSILESNIKVLGANTAVVDRITTIKSKVIRCQTNMGFMDGHLRDIRENMSGNRDKFFSAARWVVVILIGVITYMVVGIYSYVTNSDNIDKRNAVIGKCIGGFITIIIAFLLVKYQREWKVESFEGSNSYQNLRSYIATQEQPILSLFVHLFNQGYVTTDEFRLDLQILAITTIVIQKEFTPTGSHPKKYDTLQYKIIRDTGFSIETILRFIYLCLQSIDRKNSELPDISGITTSVTGYMMIYIIYVNWLLDWKSRSFPYLALVSLVLLVYFQGYISVKNGFCPIGYPKRLISQVSGKVEPSLLSWKCSANFILLCLDIFLCIDETSAMYRSYKSRKLLNTK
ncbi:hypothetical protein C6P45_000746 [Maudiozyma exigua]|uniref:Uncharacterized protein n=1 Tax=Maudiozyma exigua TaxID=34358 RepID=A0A9P6W6C5_MAUEX|nr:hypothetical protein C6P45_000746 [Kazachstania exigua]